MDISTTFDAFNGTTPSPTVWTLSGMTIETIKFREKCFIGTHWIISIFILFIIPTIWFMNKRAEAQQNVKNLGNELERQQNENTQEKSDNDPKTTTCANSKSEDTETHTTTMDENPDDGRSPSPSPPLPSSPSEIADNTHDHQQTERAQSPKSTSKSAFSISSRSRSGSRKRTLSRKKSMEEEQGERVNLYFKITAGICVFLWWACVSAEACSMMIWHYNYLIAIDIAFPWDTSRMLIYHLSKLIMYLMYMTRTYYAFNKSAYKYPQWFIITLYTLIVSDFIMKVSVYVVLNKVSSGDIQDKEEADHFLYGGFVFLVIEEFIVVLCIIGCFLKPLFRMSKFMLRDGILKVITKYMILGGLAIISSTILSLFRLLYVGSFNLMVVWLTAIWVSTDCLINTWCMVLLFKFATPTYSLLCGCCDKRLRGCIKGIYEKRLEGKKCEKTVELGDVR